MNVLLTSVPILFAALVTLVLHESSLVDAVPLLYSGTLIWVVITSFDKTEGLLSYFRPSTLMCVYVAAFFSMGTFAFSKEWVLDVADQHAYYHLPHFRLATFFFLCAIWVTHLTRGFPMARISNTSTTRSWVLHRNRRQLLHLARIQVSIAIAVLSLCIDIELPGGAGDFSSCFFMFSAIHLSYVCSTGRIRYRFFIYLALCAILAMRFYADRRLVAFYAFTICFLELLCHASVTVRLRTVAAYSGACMAVFVLVIAMSIQRGVGEFDVNSVLESLTYVDDYLQSDWAMTMLFHNFEGPPATFHCYNAANHVLETGELAYGTTFLKVLFLPLPRSLFTSKPRSMVDEYTRYYYPAFRASGGSFVANLFVEFLWNFGLLGGLLLLFPGFLTLNAVYDRALQQFGRNAIADTIFLSSHSFLLFFFRGCGLDLYALFCLIFLAIGWLYQCMPGQRSASPLPNIVVRNGANRKATLSAGHPKSHLVGHAHAKRMRGVSLANSD